MINRDDKFDSAAAVILAALLLSGCFGWGRRSESSPPPPTPETTPAVSSVPRASVTMAPLPDAPESSEPIVDLEMVDAPVKLILQRLADIGGLQLIIPPNLNKTISVQYVHVPISMALSDVLKRANLRLGAGPAPNLPFDTVTVFYQLPANIDSMSADAIMRRFGVTKAMAELIVKSRRP